MYLGKPEPSTNLYRSGVTPWKPGMKINMNIQKKLQELKQKDSQELSGHTLPSVFDILKVQNLTKQMQGI